MLFPTLRSSMQLYGELHFGQSFYFFTLIFLSYNIVAQYLGLYVRRV